MSVRGFTNVMRKLNQKARIETTAFIISMNSRIHLASNLCLHKRLPKSNLFYILSFRQSGYTDVLTPNASPLTDK